MQQQLQIQRDARKGTPAEPLKEVQQVSVWFLSAWRLPAVQASNPSRLHGRLQVADGRHVVAEEAESCEACLVLPVRTTVAYAASYPAASWMCCSDRMQGSRTSRDSDCRNEPMTCEK